MKWLRVYFKMIWIVLIFTLPVAYAEGDCDSQTKCSNCIQRPECMWCSEFDTSESDSASHCIPISNVRISCQNGSLENPENSQEIVEDLPLSGVLNEPVAFTRNATRWTPTPSLQLQVALV
ncbi:hypothetical protein SK128_009471 [Halocaridina rubra]|uniref:Integrin beta N-terminal domain-containing protein n=1 Tax=Halocaridina rubra TaxID=373956 RepID=A0AAN8WY69_HALRR